MKMHIIVTTSYSQFLFHIPGNHNLIQPGQKDIQAINNLIQPGGRNKDLRKAQDKTK